MYQPALLSSASRATHTLIYTLKDLPASVIIESPFYHVSRYEGELMDYCSFECAGGFSDALAVG
jgi:hypothetical protein